MYNAYKFYLAAANEGKSFFAKLHDDFFSSWIYPELKICGGALLVKAHEFLASWTAE